MTIVPFFDTVYKVLGRGILMTNVHRDQGARGFERLECRRYQSVLRNAARFVLDDDAVRLCVRACVPTKLNSFELWSVLARLPYDTMWLEYSPQAKVSESEKLGRLLHPYFPDEVAPVAGMLFEREPDSETRWCMTEFSMRRSVPHIAVEPVVLVFDPNGSILTPVTGSTRYKSLTLSRRTPPFPPIPFRMRESGRVIAIDSELVFAGMTQFSETEAPSTPDWTYHKVGAVPTPLLARALAPQALQQLVQIDVRERASLIRFLLAVLGAINEVPVVKQAINRPGKTLRDGKLQSFWDYHVISIPIPKKARANWLNRALDRAGVHEHRRRHDVRGHWRIIEYGPQVTTLCRHIPLVIQDDGVALCERCERKIRWIKPFQRGDAALGFVHHDYKIVKR